MRAESDRMDNQVECVVEAVAVSERLMQFKSHIAGRNATVNIYSDRIEWDRPRWVSGSKITAGVLTGGLSLLGASVRSSKAGTEVIPIKAISSVTTKRDGLLFTKVMVTCSGNTLDFRVPHGDSGAIKSLLTDLVLGRHPAQTSTSSASSAPTVAPSSAPSIADELSKLAALRRDGVLTDEEFDAQKQKLLERGP